MKKILAAAVILSAMSSHVCAYENNYAGYKIRDFDNAYILQTQKIYAYTVVEDSSLRNFYEKKALQAHMVSYYESEEVEQRIGDKFSTAYFNEQYEKLALLERSGLNINLFPISLLEFFGGSDSDDNEMIIFNRLIGNNTDSPLERALSIGKSGKHKTITASYKFRKNDQLNAVDITMLSFNDKLFLLTTLYAHRDFFAEKDTAEQNKAAVIKKFPPTIENVDPSELPKKILDDITAGHDGFLKVFKQTNPSANNMQSIEFYDRALKKKLQLPKDWFSIQLKVKEPEGEGTVLVAGNMSKAFQEPFLTKAYQLYSMSDNADIYAAKNEEQIAASSKYLLEVLDSCMLIASFKSKNGTLEDMAAEIYKNKDKADILLTENMEKLKNSESEYFSLKNYDYNLDIGEKSSKIKVKSHISFYDTYDYMTQFTLSLNNKYGTLGVFLNKENIGIDPMVQKVLSEYNF